MYALVTRFQRRPERLGETADRFRNEVVPVIQQQSGFQRAYLLIDRSSGAQLGISVWDSQQAAQAASEALRPTRERSAQELGDPEPPTVEVFEVAAEVDGA